MKTSYPRCTPKTSVNCDEDVSRHRKCLNSIEINTNPIVYPDVFKAQDTPGNMLVSNVFS